MQNNALQSIKDSLISMSEAKKEEFAKMLVKYQAAANNAKDERIVRLELLTFIEQQKVDFPALVVKSMLDFVIKALV